MTIVVQSFMKLIVCVYRLQSMKLLLLTIASINVCTSKLPSTSLEKSYTQRPGFIAEPPYLFSLLSKPTLLLFRAQTHTLSAYMKFCILRFSNTCLIFMLLSSNMICLFVIFIMSFPNIISPSSFSLAFSEFIPTNFLSSCS